MRNSNAIERQAIEGQPAAALTPAPSIRRAPRGIGELFDAFLSFNPTLDSKTIAQCNAIWTGFNKWLLAYSPDRRWDTATADEIALYLTKVAPRTRRAATGMAKLATAERYAAVLGHIYARAMGVELSGEVPPHNAIKIFRLSHGLPAKDSFRLNRYDWGILMKSLRTSPSPTDASNQIWLRNRAIMLLICENALTCRELIALKAADCVTVIEGIWSRVRLLQIQPSQAEPAGDERTKSTRTIELSRHCGEALSRYLEARTDHADLPSSAAVFASRKTSKAGKHLTPTVLYHLCANALSEALGDRYAMQGGLVSSDKKVPDFAHLGPNALRNSCIARWFEDGLPEQEIRRRIGISPRTSLDRIALLTS